MKILTTPVRIAILGTLATSLHAKDPVLRTPGTATWTTEATSTGTRTVFTLTKNTVFDWEQLNLKSGSELVFDFKEGKTVVNFLGGTETHMIDGAVTSNGIVAFFSPTADLEVNGSIIAKGVTLATLNADADEFSKGNGYKMSGPAGFNFLTVNGHVEATEGDVVLGGERVIIGDTAKIKASQDVLIGGGRDVSVAASGDRRLKENSGFGYVLHMGETSGSRIEVAAGREISNQGRLDAGKGRIFLEVGENGMITNESGGVIVGDAVFNGNYNSEGVILGPDEGDIAPPVGDSTLAIPKLSRPDGTKVSSEPQTFNYSSPMSASSDAGRDSNVGNGASVASVASVDRGISVDGPTRASSESTVANTTSTTTVAGSARTATSASVIPQSTRVGGTKLVTAPRTAANNIPVSTSNGVRRDSSYSESAEKRVAQRSATKLLLQRSSFFGMRGGNTAIAKR